jgi:hypothetical protein
MPLLRYQVAVRLLLPDGEKDYTRRRGKRQAKKVTCRERRLVASSWLTLFPLP